MQIVAIETFPLKIPSETPYLGIAPEHGGEYFVRPPWRSLYSDRYETLLVRLVAEDGSEGWGEALAPVGPEITASIIERLLAPVLLGRDAREPRTNWYFLRGLMRERGHLVGHQADALAALDIALWDLYGNILGLRLVDLLGGALRNEVPVYVSGLPSPSDAGRADLARNYLKNGAKRFKLHLGFGVAEDLRIFDVVREAAPLAAVAVDSHWAYSLHDALALCAGLEERGAWFLEAPLAPEDLRSHAELVSRSRLPIAIGETLRSRYEFAAWIDAGALSIAQPDVARTGITEALAIAELCSVRNVPVALHHSTGLGVSVAAGLHVSAVVDQLLAFEYQPTSVALSEARLGTGFRHDAGQFALPTDPGLGLAVDIDTVRKLQKGS